MCAKCACIMPARPVDISLAVSRQPLTQTRLKFISTMVDYWERMGRESFTVHPCRRGGRIAGAVFIPRLIGPK